MNAPPGWEGLLDEGEKILWQGRPNGRFRISIASVLASMFGLFFMGFAVIWTAIAFAAASSMGGWAYLFPLWGVPFIVVGACVAFGPHLGDVYRRRHTWYTLTNRRAIIARAMFGRRSLDSYPITPETRLEAEFDSESNIFFAENITGDEGETLTRRIGFEMIDEGRSVYEVIRRVQRGEA